MAIDAANIQNTSVRIPVVTDLPLDQRTIDSLGLPTQVDRRDLLAFLSNQAAKLSTVVDPPLFRSLDGEIAAPSQSIMATDASLTDVEREMLQSWTGEAMGLKAGHGNFAGSFATLTDAQSDGLLGQFADSFDEIVRTHAQRVANDAAHPPADGAADDGAPDPAAPLPDAPANSVEDFFNQGVFKSELSAMEDFDLSGWKKSLRDIAKKGDAIALIMAVFAFVEERGGKVFKAFAQDQMNQNDRLAAAADLSQKIPVLSNQDPRMADNLSRTLNIKVSSLNTNMGGTMARMKDHLNAMQTMEATLKGIKDAIIQTQQGTIRHLT